jgi:lipid II:glycine glycyltransferase (peptidoglycan interpeptide bridge formation enzyme)
MLVDITPIQLRYLHFLESHKIKEEKIFINQSEAFKRFGRANVERWRENGLKAYKRPKTLEYKMSDLLEAASNRQDY